MNLLNKFKTVPLFTLVLLSSCGDNAMKFSNIYSWVNSLNELNVKEIIVEEGYIGTSPENTLISINKSSDSNYIKNCLKFIKESELIEDKYTICGGKYLNISYVTNEDVYRVRMNNNYIFDSEKSYIVKDTYNILLR